MEHSVDVGTALSVCLCVGVCLSVDSGALMLKDVSSFLYCTGLLWRSCCAAVMSCMCHCRTFSSGTTARADQNGMFILSISTLPLYTHVSLSSCHSLIYSLPALYALENLTSNLSFKLFCHYAPSC